MYTHDLLIILSCDNHMTGFNSQVTSVCFLDVSLEEDPSVPEENEHDLLHGNHPLLSLSYANTGHRSKVAREKAEKKVCEMCITFFCIFTYINISVV